MKVCIKAQVKRSKTVIDTSRQARFFFSSLTLDHFLSQSQHLEASTGRASGGLFTAETEEAFESFAAPE